MIDERFRAALSISDENKSSEITLDKLKKFLKKLNMDQIKDLQDVIERDKIEQALNSMVDSSSSKRKA